MYLTDPQWEAVKAHISTPQSHKVGRGRPRRDDRAILEAILWIWRSGATWSQLPRHYPPRSTCHDRFQAWKRSGVLFKLLKALAEDLIERGELNLDVGYIAALFAPARRRNALWAPAQGVMSDDLWAWQTLTVLSSPSTWQALPPFKARWLKRYVREGLLNRLRRDAAPVTKDRSSASVPFHPPRHSAAHNVLS